MSNWKVEDIPDLNGKICIVTGANSGIGYFTAFELGKKHATVICACRNKQKADLAIQEMKKLVPDGRYIYEHLDLADLHSIKDFSHKIGKEYKKLDILINNAGVMGAMTRLVTKDGFESHMGTNHFGPFALTAQLMPLLQKSSDPRIITVSSLNASTGSIPLDDMDYKKTTYFAMTVYGSSKLANLLFTFELDRRLKAAGSKVQAVAVHPGWSNTNIQNSSDYVSSWLFKGLGMVFAQNADKGAWPSLFAATAKDIKGGLYYGPNGLLGLGGSPVETAPPAAAIDTTVAKKLFELSELRTNVQFLFK
eukprot:NODE_202_length_13094_cov_1.571528.p5 type:complete len:307 gc:universal NODE_202_length_13094_cov_1.571528:7006-6086(-)